MCLKFNHKTIGTVSIRVCVLLPPAHSTRNSNDAHKSLICSEPKYSFTNLPPNFNCGDMNRRCSYTDGFIASVDTIPERDVIGL